MYFNEKGLILEDQGDQVLYIGWKTIHAVYRWVVLEGKKLEYFPIMNMTRDQWGFILANYTTASAEYNFS